MRLHHWLAPVLSVLLAVAGGGVSSAQAPSQAYPPSGAYYGNSSAPAPGAFGGPGAAFHTPAPYGTQPVPEYSPGYGSAITGAHEPAGWPAPAQPWPKISPYDHQFSQHYVEDGLWKHDANNRGRNFFFSLEALSGKFQAPERGLVGDPLAPPFERPDIDDDDDDDEINFPFFPAYNLSGFQNLQTAGIRTRAGFFNPDDSGMVLNLWWLAEDQNTFRPTIFGPRVPFLNQTDLAANSGILRPFGGLPVQTPGGGITLPYDMEYRLDAWASAWGGNLDWVFTPIWKGNFFKVRPLAGARYMQVRERFQFYGVDSGLAYIMTVGDGNFPLTDISVVTDPFYSQLISESRSHLAGPEIGLRYDLGGEDFKIWGQSIFALAANHEKVRIESNRIGAGTSFPQPTPDNPNPTILRDEERHTHVSPIFEQSVFADLPIFGLIPLMRETPVLESAVFRVGYTFIMVGELARPHNSIEYRGFPAASAVSVSRSNWYTSHWSFALDWKF